MQKATAGAFADYLTSRALASERPRAVEQRTVVRGYESKVLMGGVGVGLVALLLVREIAVVVVGVFLVAAYLSVLKLKQYWHASLKLKRQKAEDLKVKGHLSCEASVALECYLAAAKILPRDHTYSLLAAEQHLIVATELQYGEVAEGRKEFNEVKTHIEAAMKLDTNKERERSCKLALEGLIEDQKVLTLSLPQPSLFALGLEQPTSVKAKGVEGTFKFLSSPRTECEYTYTLEGQQPIEIKHKCGVYFMLDRMVVIFRETGFLSSITGAESVHVLMLTDCTDLVYYEASFKDPVDPVLVDREVLELERKRDALLKNGGRLSPAEVQRAVEDLQGALLQKRELLSTPLNSSDVLKITVSGNEGSVIGAVSDKTKITRAVLCIPAVHDYDRQANSVPSAKILMSFVQRHINARFPSYVAKVGLSAVRLAEENFDEQMRKHAMFVEERRQLSSSAGVIEDFEALKKKDLRLIELNFLTRQFDASTQAASIRQQREGLRSNLYTMKANLETVADMYESVMSELESLDNIGKWERMKPADDKRKLLYKEIQKLHNALEQKSKRTDVVDVAGAKALVTRMDQMKSRVEKCTEDLTKIMGLKVQVTEERDVASTKNNLEVAAACQIRLGQLERQLGKVTAKSDSERKQYRRLCQISHEQIHQLQQSKAHAAQMADQQNREFIENKQFAEAMSKKQELIELNQELVEIVPLISKVDLENELHGMEEKDFGAHEAEAHVSRLAKNFQGFEKRLALLDDIKKKRQIQEQEWAKRARLDEEKGEALRLSLDRLEREQKALTKSLEELKEQVRTSDFVIRKNLRLLLVAIEDLRTQSTSKLSTMQQAYGSSQHRGDIRLSDNLRGERLKLALYSFELGYVQKLIVKSDTLHTKIKARIGEIKEDPSTPSTFSSSSFSSLLPEPSLVLEEDSAVPSLEENSEPLPSGESSDIPPAPPTPPAAPTAPPLFAIPVANPSITTPLPPAAAIVSLAPEPPEAPPPPSPPGPPPGPPPSGPSIPPISLPRTNTTALDAKSSSGLSFDIRSVTLRPISTTPKPASSAAAAAVAARADDVMMTKIKADLDRFRKHIEEESDSDSGWDGDHKDEFVSSSTYVPSFYPPPVPSVTASSSSSSSPFSLFFPPSSEPSVVASSSVVSSSTPSEPVVAPTETSSWFSFPSFWSSSETPAAATVPSDPSCVALVPSAHSSSAAKDSMSSPPVLRSVSKLSAVKSAAVVNPCKVCKCDEYKTHAFKKNVCSNCYHEHD